MATEPWTRVIAIDPGERVGYAIGKMRTNEFEVIEHAVLPLKEFCCWLLDQQAIRCHDGVALGYIGERHFDVQVYETWRLRPAMARAMIGNDFQPSQVIGVVRAAGWLSGAKLVGYGPEKKMIAAATMPQWLQDRKAQSNEEHDKDALDLLWHHYFTLFHLPGE